MSVATLEADRPHFDQFAAWYRGRPTQLAFAVSLVLHALLIAVVPGFRSVPEETPTVLTVQIMDVEPVVKEEKIVERKPVVRKAEPLPTLTPPPEFVPSVPQPRVVEQQPVRPQQVIEPAPLPIVRRPEQPVVEPVARAEFAPALPQDRPQIRPVEVKRPDLAPDQPVVPVVEPQPVVEQLQVPIEQPRVVRREPRVVSQQEVAVPQPQVRPDMPQPIAAPTPEQTQVVAAPVAPVPVRDIAPVKREVAPTAVLAAPPVAKTSVAPPPPPVATAVAPVPSPVPKAVVRSVEPDALKAYSQSVESVVKQHMSYPRVAVMRKWQGKTVVEMQLSPDGEVTELAVAESSGKKILDDAALTMVKKSLPLPKPPHGVRSVKVPVVFRLQG